MTLLQRVVLSIAAALLLLPDVVRSAQLSPANWMFTETDSGKRLGPEIADGNIDTAWVSPSPVKPGAGVTIDLGQEAVVDRLYFTTGKTKGGIPKSLQVILEGRGSAAVAPITLNVTVPAGRQEVDLSFEPAVTRRLRLVSTAASDPAWSIAELEIYGSYEQAAFSPADAVIVDSKAPATLQAAAEELRYYVGELTGRPPRLVAPDQADKFPGVHYRIVDLKPLASTWEEMKANEAAGKFPATPVNVERDGREVIFRAWPYANVRASVWAFLEKQGIRWVYPDHHGDFVPTGKGVNLDCLPLHFAPCAARRFANFDMAQKAAMAAEAANEPNDPVSLFWWRNGYNDTWGSAQWHVLGGHEVPKDPHGWIPYDKRKHDDYEDGFDGYPHNFDHVLPKRIVDQHPDWWGEIDGKRVSPYHGGPTVCMTSPGLIQFVIAKALAVTDPQSNLRLNLLPMDSASYCDCERCRKIHQPYFRSRIVHSQIRPFEASDSYYYMVSEVAKGIREARPGVRIFAVAYADVLEPPRKIEKLPDNVVVDVCNLGAPELPMSSPLNEPMRTCMEQWRAKCAALQRYEYVLLNESKTSFVMPWPNVTAMVDKARYFRSIGAVDGGTQADSTSIPYSPWNNYAYPRLLINPDLNASDLLSEFFTGYFREAGEPMLAYYRALEDHFLNANVSLRPPAGDGSGTYNNGVQPGTFPYDLLVKMRGHLLEAEKKATTWVVSERVARIREGFDWVVNESGFTPADLITPPDFDTAPADGAPIALDLSKIRFHKQWVALTKTGGWKFDSHGALGADVRINSPGEYIVSITAKGTPEDDLDPVMNVYINQHHAGTIKVEPGEPREFTFRQPIEAAGVSRIVITYWHTGLKGKQHLYIDRISVARARAGEAR